MRDGYAGGAHAPHTDVLGDASRRHDLARIAEQLDARLDELVATMAARVHESAPELRSDRWRNAELGDVLRITSSSVIALLRHDRGLNPEEEAMLQSSSAQRARDGVPLESLTTVVRVAATIGWRFIVEAALRLPPSPHTTAALGRAGEILADFAERTVTALIAGYSGAGGDAGGQQARAQRLADVLSGAHGRGAHGEGAQPLPDDTPHGLLLVAPARGGDDRQGTRVAVTALRAALPDAVEVPVTAIASGHVTLVVPLSARSWEHCRSAAQSVARSSEVIVFSAGPARGDAALHRAYRRGAAMVRVAQGLGLAEHLDARDLRVHSLLLQGADDHADFLDETLGALIALPATQGAPLLRTLQVLHALPPRAGMRDAAAALNVHLKTVYYRLDRIRELTGLDWDVSADRMQLCMAIVLLSLRGQTPGRAAAEGRPAEASVTGRAVRLVGRPAWRGAAH